MKLVALALPVLFAASAAIAQTDATPAGSTANSHEGSAEANSSAHGEQGNNERQICRRMVSTGSQRAERVCLTARQWREFDRGH